MIAVVERDADGKTILAGSSLMVGTFSRVQ